MSRPPKITKEWADEVAERLPDMYRNGESLAEVCCELDICKESYYKACDISPKFSYSDKRGKQLSEGWWAKLGRAGAAGKVQIQATTWMFNMKNRFNWADKIDQSNTHSITTPPDMTIKIIKAND